MPPRTGPRRKRRPKAGAPRHFTIVHGAAWTAVAVAHRIELDGGHLVLRDQHDAIVQIVAAGRWQEIRPTTMADVTTMLPKGDPADSRAVNSASVVANESMPEDREQATLVNENDPMFQLTNPAVTSGTTRKEEEDRLRSDEPFVPSSPEEAQRILMELERRLRSPEGLEVDPHAPPPPRKD